MKPRPARDVPPGTCWAFRSHRTLAALSGPMPETAAEAAGFLEHVAALPPDFEPGWLQLLGPRCYIETMAELGRRERCARRLAAVLNQLEERQREADEYRRLIALAHEFALYTLAALLRADLEEIEATRRARPLAKTGAAR